MIIYNLLKLAYRNMDIIYLNNFPNNLRNNANHYPLGRIHTIIDPLTFVSNGENEIKSTFADYKRRKEETLNTVVERTNMINERNYQ